VKLAVAATSETITVTAASPIIDVKRETTTTNVNARRAAEHPEQRAIRGP